jgi:hypothetical protein
LSPAGASRTWRSPPPDNALGTELGHDPASHALAPNLTDFLRHAPVVDLRSIRPMAPATLWSVPPDHAVELFLAAARRGVVVMGWELLCPRCRGAKSRVSQLQDLPKAAHCSSCNIDYERNFSRNVELTFHHAPWIRPLPDGERCLLGQGSARHIKFQGEVAARSAKSFDLSLAPVHTVFAPSRPVTKLIATSATTGSSRPLWRAAAIFCSMNRAGRMNSQSATRATGRSCSWSRTATGPRTR